jgi:dienelactone hydrolase
MNRCSYVKPCLLLCCIAWASTGSSQGPALPGTAPLAMEGDLAARMVEGIDRFFTRDLAASVGRRPARWKRNFASHAAYIESIEPNRQRFASRIGAADRREPIRLELVATPDRPALVAEGAGYKAYAVRWAALRGVWAEGLLLEPDGEPAADVVALPDCDSSPEAIAGLEAGPEAEGQFARRLAEAGCRVLVPALVDRAARYSGLPGVRMTNQPHREFLYRAAYEMGRHIVGFEVQKVRAAVEWLRLQSAGKRRVGVIGWGEGGLVAFYSAAVETRIDAAAVSGYFGPREAIWAEPIYRNVWSLLAEFGDAEIASLITPRPLVVEASRQPEITGPPQLADWSGAAPGRITTPPAASVEAEVRRARSLIEGLRPAPALLFVAEGGRSETLRQLLAGLGVSRAFASPGPSPRVLRASFERDARMKRQFDELLEHTQSLMRDSEFRRTAFWGRADSSTPERWRETTRFFRDYLWDEVIGRLPGSMSPPNARTRLVSDEPKYLGYEVVLDVYPDVFAYGILLVPKGIAPGERRPVVVCQHGLEGRAQDVADPRKDHPAYHAFANRLAERGFVVYAPQNPYIGRDAFRVLVRKSHPLGQSLYAVIVRQHERLLEWLGSQPFVDPQRIGFYGLSYGGKTAMRIPALLEGYALSICSADFNEWIWKNVSSRHRYSYLLTGEYDMTEWNLGNTFNYAELSWLICPRPFMVERGHNDEVAPDEWVAYEYARTRRRYDQLGIGDRTELEVFNGPHTIHGVGTFAFLHRHLRWPEPGR